MRGISPHSAPNQRETELRRFEIQAGQSSIFLHTSSQVNATMSPPVALAISVRRTESSLFIAPPPPPPAKEKQNKFKWTEAALLMLANQVVSDLAYKTTKECLMKDKWVKVLTNLKGRPMFEELNISFTALQTHFKREMKEILELKGISSEGANLSGLDEEPSEYHKIMLNMAEELSTTKDLNAAAAAKKVAVDSGLLGHERTGMQEQGSFTSAPGDTSYNAVPAVSAEWVEPPNEDHLPFEECSTPEKWRRQHERAQREEQRLSPLPDTDGGNLNGMDAEDMKAWRDKKIPLKSWADVPEPQSGGTSKSASSMTGSSKKRGSFHENFFADTTKVFDLT
ncbi:hypothetical protein B484DRAFT_466509, partial [Ochromonadaceae sp. CCMP2298]